LKFIRELNFVLKNFGASGWFYCEQAPWKCLHKL